MKNKFTSSVLHEGHVYGLDEAILACVDVRTGERKWKGGRYGNGQMVLLKDQDLLLVTSEDGELALVSADGAQPLRVDISPDARWMLFVERPSMPSIAWPSLSRLVCR